jgi:hypothetical protein
LTDTEHVTIQLETEIYGITSNEQTWFKKHFSIRLIEFEAWLETIGILDLRKSIKQRMIRCGYPKMNLVSLISVSIRCMGSVDNFTTDISEWLHIIIEKKAYRSNNKVNYIRQMLKHNNWCTGFDYMEETQ